jgi:hypothetical protein
MFKKIYKKFLSIIIVAILSIISLGSIINAQVTSEQIFEKGEESTACDLLIITPNQFKKALKPLAEHKNSYGVKTSIVTLDYIYNQIWYGRDEPEKIKYFIKNAIEETGIRYVMLVGNFRKMPIRYVYNDEPYEKYPEPCFISELYYADIYNQDGSFSSWDTNNNGIFGEWKGEEAQDKDIDLYPDVYVGRLACRNVLEVKISVKKIIDYETKTYDSDRFKRILAIAGDTYYDGYYDFPTPDFEGEENAKTAISYMVGFENTTLFTSDGTLTGPRDIIREINNGCGFLFFDGHANPMTWTTYLPNQSKTIEGFTLLSMSKLRNKNMFPVCIVGGCHNLQFDVNFFNLLKNFKDTFRYGTWVPECWGWKLTRMYRGGSIATIGCTGLGMTKEDKESQEGASDYLDAQFFYEYGINGTNILGETWGKAISNYLDKYPIDWNTPAAWDYAIDAKTVQQWVLLGDPSLKIGGYPPQ